MKALHLFAGGGGSVLAGRLLGWPHARGATQAAWESPRTEAAGHPQRNARLMALGNGWVPHQAVAAWHTLWSMMAAQWGAP